MAAMQAVHAAETAELRQEILRLHAAQARAAEESAAAYSKETSDLRASLQKLSEEQRKSIDTAGTQAERTVQHLTLLTTKLVEQATVTARLEEHHKQQVLDRAVVKRMVQHLDDSQKIVAHPLAAPHAEASPAEQQAQQEYELDLHMCNAFPTYGVSKRRNEGNGTTK